MKKYILLILVCFAFFSCKEENAELRDGYYSVEITAKYTLDGVNYKDFKHSDYVKIIKTSESLYVVSYYYNDEEFVKALLKVYDGKKVKGDYAYNLDDWSKGSIEAEIDGDEIYGEFKGNYLYVWGGNVRGGSELIPLEDGHISIKYDLKL
ncbi:MAG: hypothetical protein PHO12_05185 [Bacteroidales bacterium]|nr:hypothetical protein [Bacteroidales bacterium]MDD4683991.1 hypothetical protein [Bacteroidales bacterium]